MYTQIHMTHCPLFSEVFLCSHFLSWSFPNGKIEISSFIILKNNSFIIVLFKCINLSTVNVVVVTSKQTTNERLVRYKC